VAAGLPGYRRAEGGEEARRRRKRRRRRRNAQVKSKDPHQTWWGKKMELL